MVTKLDRQFMEKAITIVPHEYLHVTQSTTPLTFASFFSDMNLPFYLTKFPKLFPSSKTINNLITTDASEFICVGA